MAELGGYEIQATDGKLGQIEELYFDEETWVVRYIVVNVGGWLVRQPVLLTPSSIKHMDRDERTAVVGLTREQVRYSPEIDAHKPVSREAEALLHQHYDWSPYWQTLPSLLALDVSAYSVPIPAAPTEVAMPEEKQDIVASVHSHLRSTQAITGYSIQAVDGSIGHVETFLVDTLYWVIRYIIVDTGNWLRGKSVLIAPFWISDIRWAESELCLDLTQENIKTSPEYNPERFIFREYEADLHAHYGYPPYWHEDVQ